MSGYGKKKGENLATKKDMKDVLKQVADVTTTTKKIEAEISGDSLRTASRHFLSPWAETRSGLGGVNFGSEPSRKAF